MPPMTDQDWEILQQQNKAAERKKTGAEEVEDTKNSPEIKKLLELNEAHRAWFLSVSGPANYLLNKLSTIEPLDRGYGGAQLTEQIKSTASELRFIVNNAIAGNFDAVVKRIDTVSAARLRKATGPSFTDEISKEVENNRSVISRVKQLTEELEGFIEKYATRLKERRPMYGGNIAQQGVAPATGGDEVRVLSNDKVR